jgi:hypothetical protein
MRGAEVFSARQSASEANIKSDGGILLRVNRSIQAEGAALPKRADSSEGL